MTETPFFRLRNITRELSSSFRLDIAQLDVARDEILVLLGPTGAGKSTLLRLLAGLEHQTTGAIQLDDGQLVSGSMPLASRRRTSLAAQHPVMLSGTVRFNVEYPLRLRGLSQTKPRVDDMLARFQLGPLANQQAGTLSGGQRQLVSLARALISDPAALLLDEPTAHLDPTLVQRVEEAIRDIRRGRPMAVVWATHHLFQARRVATRVAFLWNGQLIETSAAASFFEAPRDPRTADFVRGRMIS